VFRISKASSDPISFKSHKGGYGVNVLLWADNDSRIRHVGEIYGACNNDARLYGESEMARMELDGRWPPQGAPDLIVDDVVIPVLTLADGIFPHTPYVCKRFSQISPYTDRMRLYDLVQASGRVVIERTFGMLATRFRIFRGTYETTSHNWTGLFADMLRACCLLHNLSLGDGFSLDEGSLRLFVNTEDGTRFCNVYCDGDDVVSTVLEIVGSNGLCTDTKELFFLNRKLDRTWTLDRCGVPNQAVLTLKDIQENQVPPGVDVDAGARAVRVALVSEVWSRFRLVRSGRRVTFRRKHA